ncbi:MAG TPA: MurR/RpiR family transcriptional regulator [Trueperaceae bacterium]|nr:MurR/RpiR family transcriptional regulator [Trueperaceae bacterium]
MGPTDLSSQLSARAGTFTATETELARHLVKHPELWGFSATTALAEALGVHRSTIVRFAQSIGYRGFPQLRETVRNAYLQSVATPLDLTSSAPGPDFNHLIHSVYERELQNLRQTYTHLDGAILEQAAREVATAKKVLVFGRRFSFTIATHTSLLLRSLRHGVRLAPDPGGSSLDAMFDIDEEDAALVFSLRRHSPEVQRAIEYLVIRGVPTTLITDAAPVADIPTRLKVLHAHIGSTSTLDSFTSLVSLSHALATIVGHLLPESTTRQVRLEEARQHFQKPE